MNAELVVPNLWILLPFGLLLGAIALGPLLARPWWEKHYPKVAFALALVTLVYYLAALGAYGRILHAGHEYVSFIVVIGALFVVSGGIHIRVRGETGPGFNTVFLFVGAILANLFGTTGASMLLIRPWIRMNKHRITAYHIVFFMFIVSNVGGCLTPVGDPPLFIGYLKGIPFWWVAEHCWLLWLIGIGYLLAVFYVMDSKNYRRTPKVVRQEVAGPVQEWRFEGLWNLVFLFIILAAVFIKNPPFVRELIMISAAAGSWFTTRKEIHEANHFNFHPLQEVAILFVGIFATMVPALDWLQVNAARLTNPSPGVFYWGTGVLSSVLDNAPTYLGFLTAAFGSLVDPHAIETIQQMVRTHSADVSSLASPASEPVRLAVGGLHKYFSADLARGSISPEQIEVAYLLGNPGLNLYIVAISIGSVFFGANTYIGNGPNFMVKAIADHQKVKTPGFLALLWKYTLPIMLPLLILIWLLFFWR